MSAKVKICGITNIEDARVAIQAGADYLGFIFYSQSPRYVKPEIAGGIVNLLKLEFMLQMPGLVGVFVNESPEQIQKIVDEVGLDIAQLSGDESPEIFTQLKNRAYKALRPQNADQAADQISKYPAPANDKFPAVLVDTHHPDLHGGTGELGNPDVINRLREIAPRLMLAGGLTAENVAEQVKKYRPFAVDVASGVEAEKGRKDHEKIRQFIQNVKGVIL